jgi:hypothetical protein
MNFYDRRLLKLADFIEIVPPKLINMDTWVSEDRNGHFHSHASVKCGTAACALGWATAVFPRYLYFYNGGVRLRGYFTKDPFTITEIFFNISTGVAYHLFGGGDLRSGKAVAKSIRKLISNPKYRKLIEKNYYE